MNKECEYDDKIWNFSIEIFDESFRIVSVEDYINFVYARFSARDWCIKNCDQEWSLHEGKIYFISKTDATLFKLLIDNK